MKAAILKAFGSPLVIEDVPAPVLGTGEVIVDVVAAGVLSYAKEVFSGQRPYLLETPVVPGAGGIGRVRAFGPDATRLSVGDWVFCDPIVRSRDDAIAPDITLQGLSAGNAEGGLRLQRYYHDGSYAEQMLAPTENVARIPDFDGAQAAQWCGLASLLVPYGGLSSIALRAGETLVVNGATGKFGSAAVEVALAMGAGRVVATGRNPAVLEELGRRFGPRVRPVVMAGDEEADRAAILKTASGPIDCVFDILPPRATPAQVRAALLTVRPNGRVSLMGGVGMQGGEDLGLPYRWIMRNNIRIQGQWMCPREAVARMIGIVNAGLIDLGRREVTTFPLAEINAAIDHAAANAGPFSLTVVQP
ncbi:alcohol dehydrogenase [Roseiarcus fermentans]|uniref:Alcohol dehydrogenase n=1 Tax=Roseiarcus fermentans TaxID=1473586 RepID=A0A366EM89_9HYPH|nr:zinc-binding dehydrogenase [Roseiarcus fermentans]RBP02565.1 alcohol dehydrogenase [Roseiarcus fermentans]